MEIQRPMPNDQTKKIQLSESVKKIIERISENTTYKPEYISDPSEIFECNESTTTKVFAVLPSFTFEHKFESQRNEMIDRGLVKSIILLPSGLLDDTNVPIILLVLSSGNKSVMMVDAAQIFHVDDNRKHMLLDEDVETIASTSLNESEISKNILVTTIIEEDYKLNPRYYTKFVEYRKNSVEFETLVKSYCCGLQLRPKEMDEIKSQEPTEYQYIEPKNIINGEIDMNLPYLSECKDSYKNHQVRNHNLVISKLGSPVKIAVAEIPENKTVIAMGRFYVFEIDEEKVSPYYVKRFLSSQIGQEILDLCNDSISIHNLKLDKLLKMPIKMEVK